MKHGTIAGAALLALALFGCARSERPAAAASPEALGFSSERLDRIRQLLRSEVEQRHIGSAVALIARDGKIALVDAVGLADDETPMFDDAIMRLASAGKTFTATAIMILYERGALNLDDPVSKFIPAFSASRVSETDPRSGEQRLVAPKRPVEVRDLLTHTAGLDISSEAFEQAWNEVTNDPSATTRDLAERIARLPLRTHPGEVFEYGSYGSCYEVLAAIVEQASGTTLEQFLDDHLFGPLGMQDSHFWVPEEKQARLARIYRTRNGELSVDRERGDETRRTSYIAGGGGVRSTVRDLFRFAQMLLDGGEIDGVRILSPKTVSLMMTNHAGNLVPYGDGEFGWGFGGEVRLRVLEHGIGSVGTFGWAGGSGAKYWIDPQEKIVAVVVAPTAPPAHWELMEKFERGMYAALTTSAAR
ncbi:MAG TPA: serine hydrolase domain-containing protein [Candidatus Polarisedimenticolaceae bacterium]|nr:serine hydrolase domain-containing protein [Candidatus Polarisedimenticolaceae bacterium]